MDIELESVPVSPYTLEVAIRRIIREELANVGLVNKRKRGRPKSEPETESETE
jgi:hypothetical protein